MRSTHQGGHVGNGAPNLLAGPGQRQDLDQIWHERRAGYQSCQYYSSLAATPPPKYSPKPSFLIDIQLTINDKLTFAFPSFLGFLTFIVNKNVSPLRVSTTFVRSTNSQHLQASSFTQIHQSCPRYLFPQWLHPACFNTPTATPAYSSG